MDIIGNKDPTYVLDEVHQHECKQALSINHPNDAQHCIYPGYISQLLISTLVSQHSIRPFNVRYYYLLYDVSDT